MRADDVGAIIFDLGRVLVDIFPEPFMRAAADIVAASPDAVSRRVRDLVDRFETGRMSTDEACSFILETPGGRWEADADSPARRRAARLLVSTLANRFAPIPETIALAHALAEAGWPLALASNTNPLDFEAIRSSYPDALAPVGDRLFLSHEMGLMKPDPRYFTTIAERLGVAPSSCVFIDDRDENAAAAEAVGMHAIRYETPGRLAAELEPLVRQVPAMWDDYVRAHPEAGDVPGQDLIVDGFGDSPQLATQLVELILAGRKRATAASLWTVQAGDEPLPYPGLHTVVLDGAGTPRCILRTTGVEIVPFDEVSADFAHAEGEDDRTLASWRREHERYFRRVLPAVGREFTRRMPLVCERFTVLWPPEVADPARRS